MTKVASLLPENETCHCSVSENDKYVFDLAGNIRVSCFFLDYAQYQFVFWWMKLVAFLLGNDKCEVLFCSIRNSSAVFHTEGL